MILQIIKLKSNLSQEVLLEKAKARAPQFEAIPVNTQVSTYGILWNRSSLWENLT